MLGVEERYDHGPEVAELLATVVVAAAARLPRGLLLTTTTAEVLRPTREYLRQVEERHRAAWADVLDAAVNVG
ncbi:hypothetical protein ACFVVA_14965 [Kitasatospora sp. NPDC058048]|uniref:hypothetical protein n=1 Tax=Kitasatospora sp. NPDC058048 TaxID=3346313 RepID=UPI0036D7B899